MLDNYVFVFLVTVLGLLGAYALIVRPRLIRWGATAEEVAGRYPGADLIPRGARSATMAVTIEAPPARVWAWLVQMGYDRAGWYSWDRLDNWGRHSAELIHPEWQKLSIGDRLSAVPDGSMGWEVAALDPQGSWDCGRRWTCGAGHSIPGEDGRVLTATRFGASN
jgi:hypothetical protein